MLDDGYITYWIWGLVTVRDEIRGELTHSCSDLADVIATRVVFIKDVFVRLESRLEYV
jgi:hypothetical protein